MKWPVSYHTSKIFQSLDVFLGTLKLYLSGMLLHDMTVKRKHLSGGYSPYSPLHVVPPGRVGEILVRLVCLLAIHGKPRRHQHCIPQYGTEQVSTIEIFHYHGCMCLKTQKKRCTPVSVLFSTLTRFIVPFQFNCMAIFTQA